MALLLCETSRHSWVTFFEFIGFLSALKGLFEEEPGGSFAPALRVLHRLSLLHSHYESQLRAGLGIVSSPSQTSYKNPCLEVHEEVI